MAVSQLVAHRKALIRLSLECHPISRSVEDYLGYTRSTHDVFGSQTLPSTSPSDHTDTPMSSPQLLWHTYHLRNPLTMSVTAILSLEAITHDTYYHNKSVGEDYALQLYAQANLIVTHARNIWGAKEALLAKHDYAAFMAEASFRHLLRAADLLAEVGDTTDNCVRPLYVVEVQDIKAQVSEAYELMDKGKDYWKHIPYGERLVERGVSTVEEGWFFDTGRDLEWQNNEAVHAVSSS